MKQNLAIVLEFGYHEIKKYITSGFAEKLSKKYNIYWFAIDKQNKEFHNYFSTAGTRLIYINKNQLPIPNKTVEHRNLSIRRAWMQNKKVGQFHNYKKIGARSLKTKLIGNNILKLYYEKKTLQFVINNYASTYIKNQFQKYEIDSLLFTSYNSNFVKAAVITAQQMTLKTWYLVNSWKDLYINNFVPFNNLTALFVWSVQMQKDYLFHCNYLKQIPFYNTGNPTLDALLDYQPKQPLTYYSKKYNFNPNAKIGYYTMMPPGLVNDEIETINLTANYLLKLHSKEELVLLIRRNPNHDKKKFNDFELPKNTILTEHFTTYDKEKDLIIQTTEGEQEWLDLLYYTHFNLSVPSTVTLEFLTLNKPVLNIAYGPKGKLDNRISQHFNAGFYKPLFKNNKLIIKIDNLEELKMSIDNIFDIKLNTTIKKRVKASDKIIKILN